jgi:AcrR family transcriptional regulator
MPLNTGRTIVSETHQPTRERILEAALRLFSEKGYLGATTKDIAAESGIAEVTLFRHFETKEKLLEDVLTTYTFLPALKEIIPAVRSLPYEESLIRIARSFLDTLCLRRDFIKILHSERHLYSEKILKSYHATINEMFITLSAHFEDLQKQGILRQFDTFLAARAFLGMFFSYFSSSSLLMFKKYGPEETEHLIKEYVGFFVRGTIREGNKKNG